MLDNLDDLDRFGKLEDVVGPCEFRLQIPPTLEHLRTVRRVAADAAHRAGCASDETDDLRIAIDEVCHAVLRSTEAPITVGFSTEPGLVEVRGAATHEGIRRPLHLAPMSQLVVDAVSDEVELADGSAGGRFTLVKRPEPPGPRAAPGGRFPAAPPRG